ncbi:MAG: macro domain-containing protein [Rhodospirillales bacterium]|nr:macro domain-containing protein [Rhodospirillales bacterium]
MKSLGTNMERIVAKPEDSANSFIALSQRIRIVVGDVLKFPGDALVTVIPETLRIHRSFNHRLIAAAGEALDDFVVEHIDCPHPGDTFSVPGFSLRTQHVLFAVVPDWKSDFEKEDRHLLNCYRGALDMAARMGLKRLVFPDFLAGEGEFPDNRAIRLAVQGIMDRLRDPLEEVWIVCKTQDVADAYQSRLTLVRKRRASPSVET